MSNDNSLYQRTVNSELPIAAMLGGAVRYCVAADVVDYVMAANLQDDEFEAPGTSVWIEWQRDEMEVGFLLREHDSLLIVNAVQAVGRGPEPYTAMFGGVDVDPLLILGFVVRGGDGVRSVVVRQVATLGEQ